MKRFFWLVLVTIMMSFIPQYAEAAFSFSQSGETDFGDSDLLSLRAFEEFDGYLYACTQHATDGLEVWRTQDPANLNAVAPSAVWTKVVDGGFGDIQNGLCNDFLVFNDELYLSTQKEVDPGELWKTSNGTNWTQVGSDGFGDSNNYGIGELVSFGGVIYAATVNTNNGSEIWKSDSNGANFTKIAVTDAGFGDANNTTSRDGIVFNGAIYFAYYNLVNGAELWRSANGSTWSQVNSDGFGALANSEINDLEEFGGFLYATTSNGGGGELWRSSTATTPASFSQVAGATSASYSSLRSMHVRNDYFFVARDNGAGSQFLSSTNGTSFTQQNTNGFGDVSYVEIPAMETFNGVTVVSSNNFGGEFKVWYPDLSPTVSNVVATPRGDSSGNVDVSFDIDTDDGADWVEARVQFSVNGGAFTDATLLEDDAETDADFGDPKVLNSNTNQIGNTSGYILTGSGTNNVRFVWRSLQDQANVQSNNVKIRVRGFSGTNGSYVESGVFSISNSDTTAPTTTASPPGGSFSSAQLVTLTCSDGSGSGCKETYFTIDGSDPTVAGVLYTGPISIQQSSQLRFFSRDFGGNDEVVKNELYVITSQGAQMALTKKVSASSGAADGGSIFPGDVLTYTVDYSNVGQIHAFDVTIADLIPAGTEYVSNSIVLNSTKMTDALDGDVADYDHSLNNQVFFDLGVIGPGASGSFSYMVKVKNGLRYGDIVRNRARAEYNPWGLVTYSNETTNKHVSTGEISGLVYDDQNGNGRKESFERGLRSVRVRVYEDRNRNARIDGGDVLVATLSTTSSGAFKASGMSAGFYIVDVDNSTIAARYQLTTGNDPGRVVLVRSDEIFTGAIFGFRSSILVPGPGVAGGTTTPSTPTTNPGTSSPVPNTPAVQFPKIPKPTSPTPNVTPPTTSPPNDVKIDEVETPINEPIVDEGENLFFERAIQFGLAPLAVAIAAINFIAGVSAGATLLPYLQYLLQIFSEPFRYFGSRKPEKFGVVYNVLTNEPVDLAIVRLYDKATGNLVESSVTDSKGRYYFIVDPKKAYLMTVTRDGFNFPSQLMQYIDSSKRLYGGSDVTFGSVPEGEMGLITYQIPVDPQQGEVFIDDNHRSKVKTSIKGYKDFQALSQEALERENNLIRQAEFKRKLSFVTSFIGPLMGILAFVLVPGIFTGIMVFVHILLFLLFWRLSSRRASNPWGVVFDRGNRDKLPQTVVRLFEPKFGRLLMTKVTGRQGNYGFLVGDKEYVLAPSRIGYSFAGQKTIVRSQDSIVQKDVGMDKVLDNKK